MAHYELLQFDDATDLARCAAERWLERVESWNRHHRLRSVALSGGRIAKTFFAAATNLALERSVSFKGIYFFWADERCVAPDHPDSNFKLAEENLLRPLGIPPKHILRIRGENGPAQAAQDAAFELRCGLTSNDRPTNRSNVPSINLVFLGMGEDGHVASLFPGASPPDPADLYYSVVAPKPPPNRVTMSHAVIRAAEEVWILASGSGKHAALQNALSKRGTTPLARVLQSRERTLVFSDIQSA